MHAGVSQPPVCNGRDDTLQEGLPRTTSFQKSDRVTQENCLFLLDSPDFKDIKALKASGPPKSTDRPSEDRSASTLISHLGRGFEPAQEASLFAEIVHERFAVEALLLLVALVGEQHRRDGAPVGQLHLAVQVVLPLRHRLEGGAPGHVEHHEGPHRLFVVDARHVSEPLLTCGEVERSGELFTS